MLMYMYSIYNVCERPGASLARRHQRFVDREAHRGIAGGAAHHDCPGEPLGAEAVAVAVGLVVLDNAHAHRPFGHVLRSAHGEAGALRLVVGSHRPHAD